MVMASEDVKVRAEQLRLLYAAVPSSIFASIFIASILVALLWSSSIPRNHLIIWYALPLVFGFIRFVFYKQFSSKTEHNKDALYQYERKFIIGVILSAFMWGLLPLALYPDGITFQVVIAFALAGMSAGAVTSLSFHLLAIRLFLLISLLPLIIRLFLSEELIMQGMSIMVVAYLAMLHASAQRIYTNTEQNIVLRLNSDRREHELERAIAERERLDELKNDFISTVTHELRTPLTSIRGSLGLVVGGAVCELPDKAKKLLDIANRNTERLLLLINDILDVQKIESKGLEFKPEEIDLYEFLQHALIINEGYANEYGVSLKLCESLQGIRILVDSDRLLQVMSNLLSNAAKFSHKGGCVDVCYEVKNQHVKILVTDHGVGIPKEFFKDVFNKFTQADTSDTKKVRGTGLGLSISKLIVESQNGKIGFQSEEGLGTTFYVEFPVVT